ncbi:aspartate kinase [Anaerolineales bacterium HSG6]|nr:aspartate kinase [Anaerolineales bacterium HSG6]MDM8531719.1 aspartate kinase [Anaerolineales bacterium HSG25]
MKFGGTSVGSVAALQKIVEIVQRYKTDGHEVLIVVSAMSGVTNLLLDSARKAEQGDEETAHQARQTIAEKHASATLELLGDTPVRDEVLAQVNVLLNEFEALCHGIRVLGELTPRALDVIGGLGERMSVPQVAAILSHYDTPAQGVNATRLIVTDRRFGAAVPLIEETATHSQTALQPILTAGQVPVITGFIGATQDGIQTTLGRGGSDYSATIIGRAIKADEVLIWTDVSGVMTTDPRIVPEAHPISHLSYSEIGELSFFGAKVLHSQAIRPARRENIPVRILNTFEPDHLGTLITAKASDNGRAVKAITAIKDMNLIAVQGPGMVGIPGIAGRVFTAVGQSQASVLMISQASSEQSICFVVPKNQAPQVTEALKEELSREVERRDLEHVQSHGEVVVLAVVGSQMQGTPGVSGTLFGALGQAKINVIAIAQGSSECNISLVIRQTDADRAVKLLHKEFGLDQPE